MAGKRNDSSQMKEILHHESSKDQKEKKEPEREQSGNNSRGHFHSTSTSTTTPSSEGVKAKQWQVEKKGEEPKKKQSCNHSRSPASSSPTSTTQHSTSEDVKAKQWHVEKKGEEPKKKQSCSSSSGEPCSSEDAKVKQSQAEKEVTSSLCELNDLRRLWDCNQNLGPLKVTRTHTILIHVDLFNQGAGIISHEGRDVWSSDHVKMPCSRGADPNSPQASRWKEISKELKSLASKNTASVSDVKKAIMKYNPKYKDQWKFDALTTFLKLESKRENHFKALFPKIAALALKLPDLVATPIPLLQKGRSATITLSQEQIACLLANAFFCTFPHRNTSSPNAEYGNYPSINFSSLFGEWSERKQEKLKAIMHYFDVMTNEKTQPDGLVTFHRRCLPGDGIPKWKSSKEKLKKLYVTSDGKIEDGGRGMLQVDFASSWIGGGVLGSGLVQEEILFLINPELIVSRLFTEKLDDNECLIIRGSQQFSRYSGFSDSFRWEGPHDDRLKRDEWSRLQREIVAIDALKYSARIDQYTMTKITRELNKAYCGFTGRPGQTEPAIATGKWGCGAFNGDSQLKALIQLMAAAKAGRDVAFFAFKDERLKLTLRHIHRLLVTEGTTLDKLYELLEDFCGDVHKHNGLRMELFKFIDNKLQRSRSQL